MVEFVFWVSFALIIYTYIGYPVQLLVQARLFPAPINKAKLGEFTPKVSIVVAARNEEKNIARRIFNLLEQDYPKEFLDIIIVSDGSDDATDRIVNELIRANSNKENGAKIRLVSYKPSKGKPFALNKGVAAATGEFIVFADCRQIFEADAVPNLLANFQDKTVGCVSGELVFVEDMGSEIQAEMGAYWRYEKMVRKAESRSGSVVGATGAIYAIRKSLYLPLPEETLIDDVLTPMNVASQGYRVLFDGSAVATDIVSKDISQEWRRKVRTLAGNWQLLSLCPSLLFPWRNPLWQRFFSHKISRLFVPLCLISLLFSSFFLKGAIFRIFGLCQGIAYLLVLVGTIVPWFRKFRVVNLGYFFVVMNLAIVFGFVKWVRNDFVTVWKY